MTVLMLRTIPRPRSTELVLAEAGGSKSMKGVFSSIMMETYCRLGRWVRTRPAFATASLVVVVFSDRLSLIMSSRRCRRWNSTEGKFPPWDM